MGSHWRPHWSYTTNGGATWASGSATLPSTGTTAALCCDTNVAFDSNGNAFLVTMTQGSQILLYVSTPDGSGNAGASWTDPTIVGSGSVDKPVIEIDRTGGAHNGNIYIAWVDYQASNTVSCSTPQTDRILLRTATYGGGVITFSGAAVQASDPGTNYNWGPALAISSSGSVYVPYLRLTTLCLNTVNAIMISRSDDGGTSFALRAQVVDGTPVSPPFNDGYSDRFSSFPTITTTDNGTVFVAWTDSGAGNMDIQSRASVTNGASWHSRVRVNLVATNDQFTPAATFTSGTLYVFYYSREGDNSNLRGGPYVATSSNGGASFSAGAAFSSTMSDPSAVCVSSVSNLCLWGDYMGADSAATQFGNEACAVWGDSRDSPSTTSNDVNVYFKCIHNSNVQAVCCVHYWWGITRNPITTVVPLNPCIIFPVDCHAIWWATFFDPITTDPPIQVTLTTPNLPTGVKVALSTTSVFVGGGYPTTNVSVNVDFSGVQCGSATCLQDVTIAATDGKNATAVTSTEVVTTVPYLILDAMAYNPHDNVNVTGIGFTANSTAALKLDGSPVGGTINTRRDGSFSLLLNLASSIFNGTHTLTSTDISSGKTASANFTTPRGADESDTGIKPPSPTPGTSTPTISPLASLLLAVTIGIIACLSTLGRRRQNTAHLTSKY